MAALAGFEEQKNRIDAKISELRLVLNEASPDGAAPKPPNPDAKCQPQPGDGLLRHNGKGGLLPELNQERCQRLYPRLHEKSAN